MSKARLIEDLNKLDEVLTELGVTAILDSGSLLGFHREGDYISGDLDLDLSIIEEISMETLSRLMRRLNANSSRIRPWGRIYKISGSLNTTFGLIDVDIKLFRKTKGIYMCPAVFYAVKENFSKDGHDSSSSLMFRLKRQFWGKIKQYGCALFLPSPNVAIGVWAVPFTYFQKTKKTENLTSIVIPYDTEAYLEYRYGDFRTPRRKWCSIRDDNGFWPVSN